MEIFGKTIKPLSPEELRRVLQEDEYEIEIDGKTYTVMAVNEYAARRKARALAEEGR